MLGEAPLEFLNRLQNVAYKLNQNASPTFFCWTNVYKFLEIKDSQRAAL